MGFTEGASGYNQAVSAPQMVDPQQALAGAVTGYTARGWRVDAFGPGQVTMVHGKRANHVLHLLLAVVTAGLWLPVWLVVGLSAREVRQVIAVDPWGRVYTPAAPVAAVDDRPWLARWWRELAAGVLAAVVVAACLLLG